MKAVGFTEVPLFQYDWSSTFQLNGFDDLVSTINFGTGANIDTQFRKRKEARPDAPLPFLWDKFINRWCRKNICSLFYKNTIYGRAIR